MRRSWAILVLAFCGALVMVHPAAATTWTPPPIGPGGRVLPGGPGDMVAAPQSRSVNGHRQTTVTSSNWAGYAATSTTAQYTSVSASWVQPAASCSRGNQYGAFWVGLDGYASATVEQAGSEADCIGRTAEYSAWYEMYPSYPVYFASTVRPGDNLTASVSYTGADVFTLVISDRTQHWTHTISATLAGAARSSAEVIAEAPCCTVSGGTLPLTNFGTLNFTGATVNNAALSTTSPVEVVMPNATPSAISGGQNFAVTYHGRGHPFH